MFDAAEDHDMKKFNHYMNAAIGSLIGVNIGYGLYVLWDYHTRPEKYAAISAPWYTGILVYGIGTLAVILLCFAVKGILCFRQKKRSSRLG